MSDIRSQLQQTLSGSYTLERELGGGGMSRVFVADETRLKRKVVVKVLSPELAQGLSAERFQREIELAASLQQANIVPVLSAGDSGGLPYYTMPFVEGESLRSLLRQRAALPINEAVSILRDVARALAYAHERGIVHRDIKPDNVLLSGGAAVVTDFGIAKAISASRTGPGSATLTQMGTSIGTPAYISPEQAAGDPDVDHRADIYSFGCMAYELLTGQPPFTGRTPQRLMAAHMGEPPPSILELRPDLPPALAAMVMRCLEKEPAQRPQSASELFAALDATSTSDAGGAALPAILLGGRGMVRKALAVYAAAFVVVAVVAKAAIVGIGLPDWVFPGALVIMALGLPVVLFTAYTQYVARRAITTSPTFTPGGTPSIAIHGTMATLAMKASPHVSWRRAALGGTYAIGAFIALVGVFMVLRTLGIGPAGSLLAAGRLKERDRIVVTDFAVKGADSSLSAVVSEAVRTQLGQSDVFTVLSPATAVAAVRRMQRPATSRLDLALAREVAQREGAKAVVDGDVTPIGAGYILSLRLVTADSGLELASFHETADGVKDLLATLDKLVRGLRGKMGESLKSVHADPPLEQVTTSSLDALRKFAEGRRANNVEGDFRKSTALLEQAVALDSTFAMAYRSLGISYSNLNYPRERADSAYAKAYRFRDRLTERERLLTIANYYGGPARDRGREITAYEDYLARYPNDNNILNNLALRFAMRRAPAESDSLLRRAIGDAPDIAIPYGNRVRTLITLGRVDEAARVEREMERRFPNAPVVDGMDATVLLARGQLDSAQSRFRALRASRNPQSRARAADALASLALVSGRLADAEQLRRAAVAENQQRGASASPLDDALVAALNEVWFREHSGRAVQILDSALVKTPLRSLSVDSRSDFAAATIYALAGRPDRARAILAQFDATIRDTTLQRFFQPDRHGVLAEIAIAEHRYADAVTETRASDKRPDGPVDGCGPCADAALGRAFDLAGQPDSAIATLERYITQPFWNRQMDRRADPYHLAGAHKRLGELYEAKGDGQRAATHYAAFVGLWKNADPELQPKVAEVRKRLARLSDTETKK